MFSFYLFCSFVYVGFVFYQMFTTDQNREADPSTYMDGYKLRKDGRRHGAFGFTAGAIGNLVMALPFFNIILIAFAIKKWMDNNKV